MKEPMTAPPHRPDLPPAARPTETGASPTITYAAAGLLGMLPFSTDVYLTTMVDLGREFGVAVAGVQQTMMAFTIGFALAHLAIGRLADRFGRRPVALIGIAVYLVGSALAVAAPSLGLLVAARFVQGAAAATGPIIARTLIRDTVPPENGGRALAKVGALFGIAPLVAPVIGTLIAQSAGWRGALSTLLVYGAILLAILWKRLPETRPPNVHGADRIGILQALRHFVRTRAFVVGALALASGYGVLFTWLTTSAFLMVGTLGITKFQASLVYMAGSGGFLVGNMIAMRLARSRPPRHVLRVAGGLMILGTLAPLVVVTAGAGAWIPVLIALLPFYLGWGLAQPMATAIAMRPFPESAGQASAWLGISQQAGGIAFGLVAATLGGGLGTLTVMVVAALAFTGVVFLPVQKSA